MKGHSSRRTSTRLVGFVGGGNMADALIRGLLSSKLHTKRQIVVSEPQSRRRRSLARRHGVGTMTDNRQLVRKCAVVVLAVKPQILPQVLEEVRGEATAKQLFVSIAAGFPLKRLRKGLGEGARLIRVMPNTPALLGKGMSVLVRGGRASAADERRALGIFRAVGDAMAVRDEKLMDAVTGVSGSGPAFVYRFAEALIEGGTREGLDRRAATRLVFRTLEGAATMLLGAGKSPAELREMVSSPGGTTLAGLSHLEEHDFFGIAAGAVSAAAKRARQLGKS